MFGRLLLSSLFLIGLDAFTNGLSWSIRLAIPLLFAANLVVAILITIVRRSRFKGVNVIGYAFIGASVLCLFIEAITRFFQTGTINLRWSIIVGACVTPVVIVLFFLHYKLKKGRYLKKTFHV